MSWLSKRWSSEPGADKSSHVGRRVTLRDERQGADTRRLWASLDDEGNLHLDGQDLGPATASVSDDREYQWFRTIGHEDLPQLMVLLGAPADTNLLDVLRRKWSGTKSYDLEKLLRESGIKAELFVA